MRKLYSMALCLLLAIFGASLAMADDDDAAPETPAPVILPINDQASKEMASMTTKIDQLALGLETMHQDLQRLNQPQPQPRPHLKNVWLKNNLLNAVNTLLLLISIVLSIILLKRQLKTKSKSALPLGTQLAGPKINLDEYDFMNSAEGMTAKLDLVRAYIAMGEMTSAKEALTEVLRQGNTEQRQEAKSLLESILRTI